MGSNQSVAMRYSTHKPLQKILSQKKLQGEHGLIDRNQSVQQEAEISKYTKFQIFKLCYPNFTGLLELQIKHFNLIKNCIIRFNNLKLTLKFIILLKVLLVHKLNLYTRKDLQSVVMMNDKHEIGWPFLISVLCLVIHIHSASSLVPSFTGLTNEFY